MSFETIYQICRITQPHFMQFLIGIRINLFIQKKAFGPQGFAVIGSKEASVGV